MTIEETIPEHKFYDTSLTDTQAKVAGRAAGISGLLATFASMPSGIHFANNVQTKMNLADTYSSFALEATHFGSYLGYTMGHTLLAAAVVGLGTAGLCKLYNIAKK